MWRSSDDPSAFVVFLGVAGDIIGRPPCRAAQELLSSDAQYAATLDAGFNLLLMIAFAQHSLRKRP